METTELGQIAALFAEGGHGKEDARCSSMNGSVDGVELVVEWRRGSKLSVWTVESKLDAKMPKLLTKVRLRGMGDAAAISSGAIVEVKTGNDAFDRVWLVEGAPREITKATFDDDAVRRLLEACSSNMGLTIDNGIVLAGVNGSHFGMDEIIAGIHTVVAVCKRLDALPAAANASTTTDQEIAALRVKQDNVWGRASWPSRIAMVVFTGVLIASVFAGVFYGCGINTLFER